MKDSKPYDAVAEVRKHRKMFGIIHWNNPELFKSKLKAAREKYHERLLEVNSFVAER
ncbi:hypothetical protein GO495_28630 [Chitinophaga oryziterrae]|uniref:Uncharacterized protein n=1 Tax=Chitinophaga oryziterrae TaxID=1031224 RepID=A0A6N8JK87_9BACT|nr:hypothetical protein [Chitinophaga oryziterrae]MVT44592.1 hypothetical protein [Chitinophaga oryziterrae]